MSPDTYALIAANPFPGLRSFKPGEHDRFFGRAEQVDALVARLGQVPLLAVSGASGCGKSSLVLAGLLNELRRRHADEDGSDWRPVVMRPGSRPIANLATALAELLLDEAATSTATFTLAAAEALPPADEHPVARRAAALYGQLRLGGLGLVEAVRQARLLAGVRVLVVVDQFEEIFRFKRATDADEAAAFVKLLLQAAADADSPVSVVLTLRSDTLGACADFRGLPEAVSRGSHLVPRLSRQQRMQAIVGPVQLRGAHIAPRLVQRLLNDVGDDFDDLPVMQHVLSRCWQRWAEAGGGGRPIDLQDYEATGGAASALSDHADEACRSLGALGAPGGLVERVFRALTERLAEGTELRRPLEFKQLCAVCGVADGQDDADVRQVVERYRRADTAFLMPGAEVPLAGNPVIDISHESLIRLWAQLRGWVQAEHEAGAELQALLKEASAHAAGQGELRRGLDLARAHAWQQQNKPNAEWVRLVAGGSAAEGPAGLAAVQGFLAQSGAAELAGRRRQRLQRLGWRAAVAAVVGASVGAAVYSDSLHRQTRSRELVTGALLGRSLDPARSAQLALAALDQDSGNRSAEYALRQAMSDLEAAQPERVLSFGVPLVEASYSSDHQRLLLAGGSTVWLLDAMALDTLATLASPVPVRQAWLAGPGAQERVLVLGSDWRVHLLAAGRPASPTTTQPATPTAPPPAIATPLAAATLACDGDTNPVSSVAVAPGGRDGAALLAIGCANGQLIRATLAGGALAQRQVLQAGAAAAGATITALGWSADGRWLASGSADGQLRVWRPGPAATPWIGSPAGTARRSAFSHDGAIHDLHFHPQEPRLLASAGDDRLAKVWTLDLDAGQLVPPSPGQPSPYVLAHDLPVLGARFVQRVDDDYRLMTRSGKRVQIWTDEQTHDDWRHGDRVTEATVSDDGELLATASSDGTALLWPSRTSRAIAVLRGHRNEVSHAFFGPQGRLITASLDGTLRRWRLQPPLLLAAQAQAQTSAAINPRGDRVLICASKETSGRSPCRIAPLADLGRRRDSAAELLEAVLADTVEGAHWSSDGTLVLGRSLSHELSASAQPVLWDAATRRRITPRWLLGWQSAAFNPGRAELVTSRDDGSLAVWPQQALAQDQPQPLLQLQAQAYRSLPLLSADGRWIAAMAGDVVLLWDRLVPQAAPRRLSGHAGDVRSIQFSRDSLALVSAGNDRTARIWPLAGMSGNPADNSAALRAPTVLSGGHSASLASAAFSPDGRWVVTAAADHSLRVWDAIRGVEVSALYRHGDAVNSASYHPDGERILSASDDGTVQLAPCHACTQALSALREATRLVALPPDELAALRR